jgi:hypothetical protein
LQDLFDQVVHDVAFIAREGAHEPGGILPPLHRQRRQLQPRDPSLGPPLQGCNVGCRQAQPHHLIEERRRLVRGETQVCRPQLRQLVARSEACQGQGRVGSGGNNEVQLRRQVLEKKRDAAMDRLGLDHVVIVQDEGQAMP